MVWYFHFVWCEDERGTRIRPLLDLCVLNTHARCFVAIKVQKEWCWERNISDCTSCPPQKSFCCLSVDPDTCLHDSCLWIVTVSNLSFYRELVYSNISFLCFSILLYSKVRDPQVMLEVGSSWLTDQTNKSLPEYGSLLELYLLHVLLPLGRFEGAEELVRGCGVFDSQQQLAFLGTICESRCQWAQQEEMHLAAEEQQDAATETVLGRLSRCCLCFFFSIILFQVSCYLVKG